MFYRYFVVLFAFVSLVTPIGLSACDDIPAHQTQTYDQLVKRTPNIVLAEAISTQAINSELYTTRFRVKKILKGFQKTDFSLTGYLANQNHGNSDYGSHNDLSFWAYANTGNFVRAENCTIFGYFRVTQQYLIFIDPPHHPRSFEIVASEDDGWYQEVLGIIDKNQPASNLSAPVDNSTLANSN